MLACQESKAQPDLQEREGAARARGEPRPTRKCNLECEKPGARGLARLGKEGIPHLKKDNLAEEVPKQLQPLLAELTKYTEHEETRNWDNEWAKCSTSTTA